MGTQLIPISGEESSARNITISGNYAYATSSAYGLMIYDITDPENITMPGFVNVAGDEAGVAISGNYAYIASWMGGLTVVDISDKTNPTQAANLTFPLLGEEASGLDEIAISDNYAYIADYSATGALCALRVVDISNPSEPTLTTTLNLGSGGVRDIVISGTKAYLAGRGGLYIVNISDPTNPELLSDGDVTDDINAMVLNGNYAYVSSGNELIVYDVSNPGNIGGSVYSQDIGGPFYGAAVSGNYALFPTNVAQTSDTVTARLFDISSPEEPVLLDAEVSIGSPFDAAISNGYVYLVSDQSIAIYNIVEDKGISYDATTFSEAATNDGSIDTVVTVTLTGDIFTGSNDEALAGVTVNNVPDGLTAVVAKKTDTTVEISFTGNATAHANANDISNLEVVFGDDAFTGGDASGITDATKSDLVIDFSSIFSSTATLTTGPSTVGLIFPSDKVKIGFWNGYNDEDTWQNAKAYYDADTDNYETSTIVNITSLSADNVDLAFIFQPDENNFSNDEILAFQNFLDAGGRIFFIGEHNGYRPVSNSIISDAINRLGGSISVVPSVFSDDLHDNAVDGHIELNNSPLMAGISSFKTSAYAPLSIDMAISKAIVVDDNNHIVIADQALSKGRVTVLADQNWLNNTNLSQNVGNQLFLKNLAINSANNIDIVADGGNPNEGGIENESNGNIAPIITSNGGGATAAINVAENSTTVTTVIATDADEDTVTYSISGGADQAKFSINANTGALGFAMAPDYESPLDTDTDNTYVVEVTANDGNGGTDVQEITVSVTNVDETPAAPTPTTPTTPPSTTTTVDGATVQTTTSTQTRTTTDANGHTTSTTVSTEKIVIAPVTSNRAEQTGNATTADVPLFWGESSRTEWATTASIPTGVGLTSEGSRAPAATQTKATAIDDLIYYIDTTAPSTDSSKTTMLGGGETFLQALSNIETLVVNKITLSATTIQAPQAPITITGVANTISTTTGSIAPQEALVIDAQTLPSHSTLQLQNVEFAVIIGEDLTIRGGEGKNILFSGAGSQDIMLGEDDDELHAGAGDDTVGSAGGDDKIFGEAGNDTVFGGEGDDLLHGGSETDIATYSGNMADYIITRDEGKTYIALASNPNEIDTLINVETITFADSSYTVESTAVHEKIATLYTQVFDRQADIDGFQYWAHDYNDGLSLGGLVVSFMKIADSSWNTKNTSEQIEMLYEYVIGHPSDVEGKNYWINDIQNNHMTIEDVAECFIDLLGQYQLKDDWNFSL